MSSCSRHASREAVGACINCGNLVCAACHKEIDGKSYCTVCVEKLFSTTEVKPKKTPPPVPVAAKPAPLPVEKDKVEAASVAQSAKSVEPVALTGTPVSEPAKTRIVQPGVKQPVSNLWWLLPLLFTWIGGVIAGLLTRDREPKKALNMFLTGLGMTFVHGIVIIAILAGSVPPTPEQPPTTGKAQLPMGITTTPTTGETQPPAVTTPSTQAAVKTGPKEETIEIKVPELTPKAPPPPPTYQTSTLTTQPLQPSDKPQTVKYEDKVAVIVPAGALKEQDSLTISAVSNAPEWNYINRSDIAVYDISFAVNHTFDQSLTFEFAYDPAAATQSGEERSPGVSYLESDGKTWTDVPVSVDEQRQKVVVATPHNGLWRYYWHFSTSSELQTPYFKVRYWLSDFTASAWTRKQQDELDTLKKKRTADNLTATDKTRLAELTQRLNALSQAGVVKNALAEFQGCLGDSSLYSIYSKHPKYVVDAATYLDRARNTYADTFGKKLNNEILSAPITRVAADGAQEIEQSVQRDKILAVVDPSESASSQSGWLGHINIHSNPNCGMTGLGVTLAHELFHAVQSMDHYGLVRQPGAVFGLVIPKSLWWFESTADYAAFKIAMGFDRPCNHSLDPAYFSEDFFSDGNPDENHPYKTAYFFDYLAGQKVAFAPLYNAVASDYRTKLALDEYLKANTPGKLGLYESYHEWYKYVLFDGNGPYKSPLQTNNRLLDTTMQNLIINLADGMTAGYQGIYPSVDPAAGKRTLIVELQKIGPEVQPQYCWVDVCKLNQNERNISNLEVIATWDIAKDSWPKEICQVDLDADDALYILVAKLGGGQSSYFINVSDQPSIKLNCPNMPAGEKGTMGEAYDFERITSGIPSTAIYIWYVDGTSLDKGGETLTHRFWESGEHSMQVKASWSVLRSAESNTCIIGIGNPLLTIKSPLGAGEKGLCGASYTFTQESKYVPNAADYWWYVNDKEISGDRGGAPHAFEAPGTYKVKVKAEWPMPEGDPRSIDDSVTVTVQTGFQITADPVPGNVGDPSRFGIVGQGIPANAGFTWNFGKQEAGHSTNTKETTHTYQAADTYPVSVTVVDRSTKRSLGTATLSYKVIAQPYAVISPRPATAKPGDKISFSFKLFNMPEDMAAVPRNHWIFTYNGLQEAWPTDEQVTFTFDRPGKYIVDVIVEARDKDNRPIKGKSGDNWLKDSISITVIASPTVVKIIGPGATGNINDEYTFIAESSPMPEGARIEWYFEGGEKYRDTDTVKHTFTTPGDKTVMVQWVIGSEVAPICKDQIQFTVVAAPTLSIKMPGDGKVLQPDKENIFYAVSTSIPGDAVYEWYINEAGVLKAQGREGAVATAPAGFFKEGDYKILVIAKWKGADLKEQWAQADANFKVAKINISLSIIPPPEIQSKTAKENTKYYFALNTDIPSTATFTWYRDGQEAGKGQSIGLAFSSGQHIVELKANWQDTDAAKTKHEQKATPLSFNIGAATTSPTGEGWHLDGAPVLTKAVNKNINTNCYIDHSVNISNGSSSSTWSYKAAGCLEEGDGCRGSRNSSVTWTPPPAYLKPGGKITVTLSAQASPAACLFENRAWISLYQDRNTENIPLGSVTTARPPNPLTLTPTVPSGVKGDRIEYRFNVYHQLSTASAVYKYVYK